MCKYAQTFIFYNLVLPVRELEVNTPASLTNTPETVLGRELVKSVKVFLVKVNPLSIGSNSSRGDRLGEDNTALVNVPGNENSGRGGIVLLGDSNNLFLVHKGSASGTEGRVGLDNNALLLTVSDELSTGKQGVDLNLVDSRNNLNARAKEIGQGYERVVGDTNSLGLASLVNGLKLLPGLLKVKVGVNVHLALGILGEKIVGALRVEANGPMGKKEVDIVKTKQLEGLVQRLFNAVVVRREGLCCDKDVLSGNLARLDGISNTLTNFLLVLVDVGGINVADRGLGQSVSDGLTNEALVGLPGTKTKDGDDGTGVKLNVGNRHCGYNI